MNFPLENFLIALERFFTLSGVLSVEDLTPGVALALAELDSKETAHARISRFLPLEPAGKRARVMRGTDAHVTTTEVRDKAHQGCAT